MFELANKSERRTEPPLLLKPAEAARLLNIGQRTLWRLMASGAIPVIRVGRSTRYDRRDLEAWVQRSKSTRVTA